MPTNASHGPSAKDGRSSQSSETLRHAVRIAELVRAAGGRALLVGGAVRDELLGGIPKDADLEVFGLEPARLESAIAAEYPLDLVGRSFGVLKIQHLDIDVFLSSNL